MQSSLPPFSVRGRFWTWLFGLGLLLGLAGCTATGSLPTGFAYESELQSDWSLHLEGDGATAVADGRLWIVPYRDDWEEPGLEADLAIDLQARAQSPLPVPEPARLARLSEEEARTLLQQVPRVPGAGAGDTLSLPAERLQPPDAGTIQPVRFPPVASSLAPVVPETAELEVLRYAPTQDMEVTPHVSVTFSLPMVALTSHATLAEAALPVSLEPQPEGTWQWLGTQTLLFQPAGRLPRATRFQVMVDAGIEALDGTALAEDFSWEFETAPLALDRTWPPGNPQTAQPYAALSFNQAVDEQALAPFLSMRAQGRDVEFALLKPALHELPGGLRRFLAQTWPERTVVLQPLQPLPPSTTLTVTVAAGAPSAEGPLTATQAQHMTLRTHGSLQIEENSCPYTSISRHQCTPGEPFHIYFNHALDPDSLTPDLLSIEPSLPNGTVSVQPWGMMTVQGQSAPNTRYTLRIKPGLRDQFGQTFSAPQEVHFQVGEAPPVLLEPRIMEVLYPESQGQYTFFSRNLDRVRVVLYQVEPAQWHEYLAARDAFREGQTELERLFDEAPVLDTWLSLEASPSEMTRTVLDLNPFLSEGKGQLALFLSPPTFPLQLLNRYPELYATWIQVTDLGLEIVADANALLVRASSLDTGEPRAGIRLTLYPEGTEAVTGPDGHAQFAWRTGPETQRRVEAQQDADLAFLPQSFYRHGRESWGFNMRTDSTYPLHVLTDRHLYQPGEKVHVKGWLRRVQYTPEGDVGWAFREQAPVSFTVFDGRGIEIGQGTARLDSNESFAFSFRVPDNANSGYAYITLQISDLMDRNYNDGRYDLSFQIEEFRRPEYEVSLAQPATHQFLGQPVPVEVTARYFGGGPLQGASIRWEVSGQRARYSPPGWDRFFFGVASEFPWWGEFRTESDTVAWGPEMQTAENTGLEGILDARGRHGVDVTAIADTLPIPYFLNVTAVVRDLSQQSRTVSEHVLVHPADHYVGVRTDAHLIQIHEPYTLTLIVTDVEGTPLPQKEIRVQAAKRQARVGQEVSLTPVPPATAQCQLQSAGEPVACDLVLTEPGHWDIDIMTEDSQGRTSLTRISRWVVSRQASGFSPLRSDSIEIVPDRDEYQPGDVAELLILSPFLPAYGTAVINRSGIISHESLILDEAQHVLEVPIRDSWLPNVNVTIFLSGDTAAEGPANPVAQGEIALPVSTQARELTVALQTVPEAVVPGGEAAIQVQVTDAAGQPVPEAEILFMAVDEAILSLTAYQHANPMETFYPHRYSDLSSYRLRDHMESSMRRDWAPDILYSRGLGMGGGGAVLESAMAAPMAASMDMAKEEMAVMADDAMTEDGQQDGDYRLRADFNPLAVFVPAGVTDEDGLFSGTWRFPDTVGRYRLVAIATSGARHFGMGERAYATHLPVQIRPQWPRFLNFGDMLEIPILVENQTSAAQEMTLLLQSDRLDLAYQAEDRAFDGVSFTLPAYSRQLVAIPARAERTGETRLLASVFNEQIRDDTLGTVPVYVPAVRENFATYGIADAQGTRQGFALPEGIRDSIGGLHIDTSSTILQSLVDSYEVLDTELASRHFPEPLAARILAYIAIRDVLYAFAQTDMPSPAEFDRTIQDHIEALIPFQNQDGGFALWKPRTESWPYVSVHVLHALAVAKAAGYRVDGATLDRGLNYLATIERRFPAYYALQTRRLITAYALHVRTLLGDHDPAAARLLLQRAPLAEQPLEVIAWSLLVLSGHPGTEDQVEEALAFVLNRVDETTGKATFATDYREQDGHLVLSSNRRSDALLLQVLMTLQPESDLIPKLVTGLLAARGPQGHWGHSQDNVFALLAVNSYFRQFEQTVPDFRARVWLDDTLVQDSPFTGRQTVTHSLLLPMPWLSETQPGQIRVQRAGEGTLYYRLGFEYMPEDLHLAPRARGFTVFRTYTGLDSDEDVWQDQDGIWHIRLGARVRIETTLVATGPRHHVMLTSPVPAGLELVNPALQGSQPDPEPYRMHGDGPYYWPWFDHQQLLDERAQAVTTYLPGGVYRYGVVAEATMAGTFQVPPARAVAVYAPETFGHGASEVVQIEAAAETDQK